MILPSRTFNVFLAPRLQIKLARKAGQRWPVKHPARPHHMTQNRSFLFRSLSARVTALSVFGVVFVLITNILVGSLALTSDDQRQRVIEDQDRDMRIAWSVIREHGGDVRVVDDRLVAGSHTLEGALDTVDEIKSLVGGAATIFRGDLRVATTIMKPDGTRATGTRLPSGPVADTVLRDGRPYRGEADVLGTPYFVAYDPIKAADGAVVGVLFVGTPQAEFFAPVQAFQRRVIISGVLITFIVALALFWTTRRLFKPLEGLRIVMERLAVNDNAVSIPWSSRSDDIGGMARAVAVLWQNAVEKLRLEADAQAAGRLTEEERARNAATLAEAAAQQSHVVELVASGLSRLSGGDLSHRIDERFPADYEKLRADFNGAMAKLQDTMRTVAASASAIRSGTGEISTASDDLSRRTEQQAASLEETAAALDEITATVRRTAEGAKHARAVVGNARGNAEQSGLVVRQAVDAMSGIERSSREISQIIGVIDEIAFQTNLLALNAGVEAARAGEAGRGFAVVASEVRALAQRSAEAAKEIKALISTSGVQVEQGVTFVGQTGEALVRIVAQVAEIDGIVGEIASSAQEQATGLDQVNTAVNQMDQVTQQNAAMVEESTAASHALSQETGELTRLIGEFRLGDAGAAPRRAPEPASRPERRSASAPVPTLRTVGRGGAALTPSSGIPGSLRRA